MLELCSWKAFVAPVSIPVPPVLKRVVVAGARHQTPGQRQGAAVLIERESPGLMKHPNYIPVGDPGLAVA